MLRTLFLLILLTIPLAARYYEFSLDRISDDPDDNFWEFYIPEGHTGYELNVAVPWGLIGAILTYDSTHPEEISVSADAPYIAQGYRFYSVDSPASPDRNLIASNSGDGQPTAPFTISSGRTQYLVFEEENIQTGWVQIAYEQDSGLRIISQSETPPPREPDFYIRNGTITVSPSDVGTIQQSTDLVNWTTVGTLGNSVRLLLSSTPGPIFFREICP